MAVKSAEPDGYTPLITTSTHVRAERERWTEYTRVAGIQPE